MISTAFANPLTLVRQERASGHIAASVADHAEKLIESVQKEAFEASKKANQDGQLNHRPYWGTSAHHTKISFDPKNAPTEAQPLQGVSEFLDSHQVYGKWGYDVARSFEADDQKLVFKETDQSVRDFSVTINANGTLTINPGEEIPVICTAGFD